MPVSYRFAAVSEVSVMPDATLTSRNHTLHSASMTTSVRDSPREPKAVCAVTAQSVIAVATSSVTWASQKNSVAPAEWRA